MRNFTNLLALIAILCISVNQLRAVEVIENFTYFSLAKPTATSLNAKGASGNGWDSTWTGSGTMKMNGNNLGNDLKGNSAYSVIGSEWKYHRFLDSTWGDYAGKVYWISFYIHRLNANAGPKYKGADWGGLSLFHKANSEATNNELLYMGTSYQSHLANPAGDTTFKIVFNMPSGFNGDYCTTAADSNDVYVLVKLVMNGDASSDWAYMWTDYFGETEPVENDADAKQTWPENSCPTCSGNTGFNNIRLGGAGNQAIAFDRIRIADFYKSAINTEAGLKNIKINGRSIDGFDSEITDYSAAVLYEEISYNVTAEAIDIKFATVNIIQALDANGTATIEVTAQDGVTKKTYMVDLTKNTSPTTITIANKLYKNISLTPNPAKNQLLISNINNANLTIYSVNGQTLKTIANVNSQNTIDISELQNGIYFVGVQQGNNRSMHKISILK